MTTKRRKTSTKRKVTSEKRRSSSKKSVEIHRVRRRATFTKRRD